MNINKQNETQLKLYEIVKLNLKEGDIFNNYKKLCEKLGLEPKKGNSAKSHYRLFDSLFKYHKEGRKIFIDEIYINLNKLKDERGKCNVCSYVGELEKILLNILYYGRDDNTMTISKYKLLLSLQMINQNYSYCKYRQEKLSEYLNIDINTINDFYNSANTTLVNNCISVLENLKNRSLIYYSVKCMICELVEIPNEINRNISYDIYGEEIETFSKHTEFTKKYRLAEPHEIEWILRAENNALEKLKCKNKSEVVIKKLWKNFMIETKKELTQYHIVFYYDVYDIVLLADKIENEIVKNNLKINKDIMDRVLSNAIKRQNTAIKKMENISENMLSKKDLNRTDNNYIEHTKILNDNLIDEKATDIREEVKQIKVNNQH